MCMEGEQHGQALSEDAVVAIAAAFVQADGALVVGPLERRYDEAECRRGGVAELGDDPVDEGVEGRNLGATRKVRGPLPDGDVDVGGAGLAEDGALDAVGRGLGLLEDDSLGATPMIVRRRGQNGISSPALAQLMPVMAVNPR